MDFSLDMELESNKKKRKELSPILFVDLLCTSVNGKYFSLGSEVGV